MQLKKFLLISLLMFLGVLTPVSAQYYLGSEERGVTLGAYAQAGFGAEFKEASNINSFYLRRAIIHAKAHITDKWTAMAVADFAKGFTLLDLYAQYSFAPQLNVRLGQFKNPVGWENQFNPATNELVEGSILTNYVLGNGPICPFFSGHSTTGRDIGLEVSGALFNGLLDYRLDVLNGNGINHVDNNTHKSFGGSLTLHPLEGLSLNGSALYGRINMDIAGVNTRVKRLQWGAAAAYTSDMFDLRAEGLFLHLDSDKDKGYNVTGVAHFSDRVDGVAAFEQLFQAKDINILSAVGGVQYNFSKRCRLQAQYIFTQTKNKVVDATDDAHRVVAQLQVSF